MIVLLGDYSSVHYELEKALRAKGKKVLLISDGDAYKNIKADILIPPLKKYKNKIINYLFNFYYFFGMFGIRNYLLVKKELSSINNIECVQLINPVAIDSLGALGNIMLLRYLKKREVPIFLCSLGDDTTVVNAYWNKKYKYSFFDRINWKNFFKFQYSLKYKFSPIYRLLDYLTVKNVKKIIPGVIDYQIAYKENPKVTKLIPLPIDEKNFMKPKKTQYPLKIFHAWQAGKELRKGNDIFDRVIKRYLTENKNNKIDYEIISGLTYDEYLKKYSEADIILDQVYSYGCGVTGALGLAASKVVFSGFEIEGNFDLGVNATKNEEELYTQFVKLVDNLSLIDAIKIKAYNYAIKNYNSKDIANKYIIEWEI